MSKINVKISIINNKEKNEFETNAIILDEEIKYKAQDGTIEKYNYKTNELIRENNELRMNYIFDTTKKTIGKLFIKELNSDVELNIITDKLERKNNNIHIIFKVESEQKNIIEYIIEEIK